MLERQAEQLDTVDEALAALMEEISGNHDFSAPEMAEIEQRLAEIDPEYADPAEIERIFGKPFRA